MLSDQSISLRQEKSAEEDMLFGLGLPLRLLKDVLQRLHLLGPLLVTTSFNYRLRFGSAAGVWGAVQFVWLNFRRRHEWFWCPAFRPQYHHEPTRTYPGA